MKPAASSSRQANIVINSSHTCKAWLRNASEMIVGFYKNMDESRKLGDLGERIAEKYLKKKGYKILDKNFRYSKLGELDLVAHKGAGVVFFEVKARRKKRVSDFLPEDSITFNKQKKLIKLSQIYLAKKKLLDHAWQIDILAIEIYRNGTSDIRHLENAIEDFW